MSVVGQAVGQREGRPRCGTSAPRSTSATTSATSIAARDADAMAVAVATGPISATDTRPTPAPTCVLADLRAFRGWLKSYLVATVH